MFQFLTTKMKFSKTLQHLAGADTVYGSQYIHYELLKKFLNDLRDGTTTKEAAFVQMLKYEHQRVTKIADYK